MPQTTPSFKHMPVLVQEVLAILQPGAGQSYLDLTAGYGGHAAAILDATKAPKTAVLVDRDRQAIAALKARFKGQGIDIVQSEFLSALENLAGEGRKFDMVLADLGVSSPHLEDRARGFFV